MTLAKLADEIERLNAGIKRYGYPSPETVPLAALVAYHAPQIAKMARLLERAGRLNCDMSYDATRQWCADYRALLEEIGE